MRKFRFYLLLLVVTILMLHGSSFPVYSYSLINGGFETGDFTGWLTFGNSNSIFNAAISSTPSGTIVPYAGDQMAMLYTGLFSNSNSIAAFLNTTDEVINATNDTGTNATYGCAIKQSITSVAGDNFTFAWNFATNKFLPNNEWAIVVVYDGINTTVQRLSSVNETGTNAHSGWQIFTYTVPTSNTYTFGFGMLGVNSQGSTQLYVDSVDNLNGSVPSVPEPSTWLMLVSSLVGLIGYGWRQKQKSA